MRTICGEGTRLLQFHSHPSISSQDPLPRGRREGDPGKATGRFCIYFPPSWSMSNGVGGIKMYPKVNLSGGRSLAPCVTSYWRLGEWNRSSWVPVLNTGLAGFSSVTEFLWVVPCFLSGVPGLSMLRCASKCLITSSLENGDFVL
jgi:hypothetical protein